MVPTATGAPTMLQGFNGGDRADAGSSQGSRRGLGRGWVELEHGNSRGTGGTAWRQDAGRARSGAGARQERHAPAPGPNRGHLDTKIAPLGLRGHEQHKHARITQELDAL